ncbi:S8 family serine peptidase [Nocardioides albus]|uniref:Subtilisin family serine protease n=1 Tax=Nocardioides albus TaxID=1841 RepID=A0A7W5A7A2_9ACTN|nr:S8 family serine peptidase [Nocardioides albus]MBB3090539.1 subtilisin family serine protease [Nocardioides albus]GGU24599.1 peptidase [Nocardioides albus]
MSVRTRSRRVRVGVVMGSVGLMALTPFTSVSADPADQPDQTSHPSVITGENAGRTTPEDATVAGAVTLITGDTVTVTATPDGRHAVSTEAAPGTSPVFRTETGADGGTYVYPDSAARGIATGRLDKELFNVTRLLEEGHGDDGSATLPVIVDYPGAPDRSTLQARAAAPGATEQRPLASIGATAMEVDKAEAGDFYRYVADRTPNARIMLDGEITGMLDVSVPQIGAPEVWEKGYDGTGVDVAVLDSGIDATHPDLAGRVVAEKSFIPGLGIQDGTGHGTHVASTIVGSGAASDGVYRGVAPGADLIVGRVLDGRGSGDESGLIAAMEWAVGQGADVVNLSVGAETTEGSDPVSRALDELSESSGALFVVAAGNTGPRSSTVSSPGTATTALTVGAVDDADQLAGFSSRGPTASGAIKPEITAPGVGIVAARAAGTRGGTPVGTSYVSINGTSMATPHVAGAAALLVQQHPDWGARMLKDALVSTARPGEGYTVYQQGAGRVAVDRASAGSLFATATADFGDLFADQTVRTRTVTYTNTGTSPVTLALDLALDRGDTVPDGAVTLADRELLVPAASTVATTINVDPRLGGLGRYNGYLRASGSGVDVVTAVGYVKQPPRRTVRFTLTGRDGRAAGQTTLVVTDLEATESTVYSESLFAAGTHEMVLPEGRYAIQAVLRTYDDAGYVLADDIYAEPEVVLDADATFELDARDAKPVRATITDEGRSLQGGPITVQAVRERAPGVTVAVGTSANLSEQSTEFGVIPSTTRAADGFDLTVDRELHDPIVSARWASPSTGEAGQDSATLPLYLPALGQRFDGTRRLDAVDAGEGRDEDYAGLAVTGKLVVVRANGWLADEAKTAVAHGAAGVLAVRTTPGVTVVQDDGASTLPVVATPFDTGQPLLDALSDGPVTVTLQGRTNSRFTYRLPFHATGAIPADPTVTATTEDFARLVNTYYADGTDRLAADTTFALYPWQEATFRTNSLHSAPATRTDLVYADGMSYMQHVNLSMESSSYLRDTPQEYEAGRIYHRDWGRAPMHPTVPLLLACPLCRSSSAVSLVLAPLGDSDTGHFGADGTKQTVRYYRDGVQRSPAELFAAEKADYRVDYQVERTRPAEDALGIRTSTSFLFRSQAPAPGTTAPGCDALTPDAEGCEVLPMIFPGYDIPLDLHNAAPTGHGFTFEVSGTRPDGYQGAPVTDVAVEVSYDDGSTWVAADHVSRVVDGRAKVRVDHPKVPPGAGHVSLRVTMADEQGTRTEQTVLRAYALR